VTAFDEQQARCPVCGEQSLLVSATIIGVLRVNDDGNISRFAVPYGHPEYAEVYLDAPVECNSRACGWTGRVAKGEPGEHGRPTTVVV